MTGSNSSKSAAVDIEHLTGREIARTESALRNLSAGAHRRQKIAERIVSYFFENFRDPASGEPAFVLARCFQTCAYARLPLHYRDAADHLLDAIPSQPEMRCLALLATRGIKSLWNDPVTSVGHLGIPLPSVDFVRQAPMIARLLEQFGLSIEQVIAPTPALETMLVDSRDFDVFHIPQAPGSPFIPAQETFVQPFGVRSVIGMGGLLRDGDFFAVILFSRVPISAEAATAFRTLGPTIKEALLPFAANQVFQELHD